MTEQFPALHADWRPDNGKHKGQVTKVLLHTTEGSTVSGAQGVYNSRGRIHPHVTYDPRQRYGVQHVSVHKASFSIKSRRLPWPHSFNRDGVFQIEIVGYASKTPVMPNEWYEALVLDVLDPLFDLAPAIQWWHFARFVGSSGYGTRAAQRFGMATWLAFNGVVGHQHAPAPNSHWDPGAIRVSTLAAAIVDVREPEPIPPDPIPPPEEDDMTPAQEAKLDRVLAIVDDDDYGNKALLDTMTKKFRAVFEKLNRLLDHFNLSRN